MAILQAYRDDSGSDFESESGEDNQDQEVSKFDEKNHI